MTPKPPRPPNTPPKIFPRFFVSGFGVRPAGSELFPGLTGGIGLLPGTGGSTVVGGFIGGGFMTTTGYSSIYGMLSDTSNLNCAVPFYFATKLTNKLSLTLTV